MSEQELENKMKQILDDYAPILNVTPRNCIIGPKTITNQNKEKTKKYQKILSANQTSNPYRGIRVRQ
jgi:hypothetical protein